MGYQNKMTGHDFRALTMSTIKERLGYRHEVVDQQLTEKDFDDWRNAKVLQYFDLISISELDGNRISNHVIGDLLFPDEVDVDVAERVRKVTKRKAQQVFTGETSDILHAQK
jgi:hypothetical protein